MPAVVVHERPAQTASHTLRRCTTKESAQAKRAARVATRRARHKPRSPLARHQVYCPYPDFSCVNFSTMPGKTYRVAYDPDKELGLVIQHSAEVGAIVVQSVAPGGQSSNGKVQVGDVVTHVGKIALKGSDVTAFTAAMQQAKEQVPTRGRNAKKLVLSFVPAAKMNRKAKTPSKTGGARARGRTPTRSSRKSRTPKKTAATSDGVKSPASSAQVGSARGRRRSKSKGRGAGKIQATAACAPPLATKTSERLHHQIPMFVAFTTYFGYAILTLFGKLRDLFGRCSGRGRYFSQKVSKGKAPLVTSWENFYTRRMYHRIQDVFSRPITGAPAASKMKLLLRDSKDGNMTLQRTGESRDVINLGSYNYLGFADDWQETCRDDVVGAFNSFGPSMCSAPMDAGRTVIHEELETLVAGFLDKEACCVFNMGYGTNATSIPALMGKGSLIVSDSLNHSSIVNGARASGAKVRVFKHDNPNHLEQVLRNAIVDGQPRTHRPWKKILVIIEGVYSMEGEICHLREIVDVCKKFKAYVYVDEAHSIGALGPTGRGVAEQQGVDTADIDIFMGTFTKSFGGMGGYIAGSRDLIDYIRQRSAGSMYSNAMSPIICKQILRALQVIMGLDGSDIGQKKLQALKNNSNYFREGLIRMGLQVLGDADSPVMPVLLYNPTKIAAFSRECLKRGLAVVTVGFPATPLVESRARFCISAGHTKGK